MVFKCKMCGGDLIPEAGKSFGICDSCGTQQTLPNASDDRRANLFTERTTSGGQMTSTKLSWPTRACLTRTIQTLRRIGELPYPALAWSM
ncbi:MAG: hypothetical protein LBT59_28845 [Clostridiales bacterium]|nr:hypothetical protein [Clostridiales bacterium]